MTSFLIDTNVISEIRKGSGANPGVQEWFASVDEDRLYISALVVGEIRRGIERIRRRDPVSARHLESWLLRLRRNYSDRILDVTEEVAEIWGQLSPLEPIPPVDGLMVATAMFHNMTLVTRNEADVQRSGARILNPFTLVSGL